MRATNTGPKGQINAPDQLDYMSTLRTEHLEQSRLLGMSGERECALLGEIDRLKTLHTDAVKCLGEALQESTDSAVVIERKDTEIERLKQIANEHRDGRLAALEKLALKDKALRTALSALEDMGLTLNVNSAIEQIKAAL